MPRLTKLSVGTIVAGFCGTNGVGRFRTRRFARREMFSAQFP